MGFPFTLYKNQGFKSKSKSKLPTMGLRHGKPVSVLLTLRVDDYYHRKPLILWMDAILHHLRNLGMMIPL